jgi:hypothetical protein
MTSAGKIALAVLCCASMWLYVDRVLVPHQNADAAIQGTARGNLSDLYPSWLAARELLLHQRDPYSLEITREIQSGYFGRPLDPTRQEDPTNQQAFAYPAFVVFFLAPVIHLPFSEVQTVFRWLLAAFIVLSVPLWRRALGWKPPRSEQLVIIVLVLGTFSAVQGIKLQQLTLLVLPLIAATMALLVSNQPAWAGIFLALATVKPQLSLPLAAWLLLWAAADLRKRWQFVTSFLLTSAALIVGAELLLPGWIPEFYRAIAAYRQYAAGPSLLETLAGQPIGIALGILLACAVLGVCWRVRKSASTSDGFAQATSLVIAATLLVIPVFAPHYQLLLLPAVLILLRRWEELWKSNSVIRNLLRLAAASVIWPWCCALVLVIASFFTPQVQRLWQMPLWTSLAIPITITACLIVVIAKDRARAFTDN